MQLPGIASFGRSGAVFYPAASLSGRTANPSVLGQHHRRSWKASQTVSVFFLIKKILKTVFLYSITTLNENEWVKTWQLMLLKWELQHFSKTLLLADQDTNFDQVNTLLERVSALDEKSAIICFSKSHYYAILSHGKAAPVIFAPEGEMMYNCPRFIIARLKRMGPVQVDPWDKEGLRFVRGFEISLFKGTYTCLVYLDNCL